MSSDRGFILTDVLIAVVIITLCAQIISATAHLYSTVDMRMRQSVRDNEQVYRAELQRTEECILCSEENPE